MDPAATAAMFAQFVANPALLAQMGALLAAQTANQNLPPAPTAPEQPVHDPDRCERSPTLGRSSDPVDPAQNAQRGRTLERRTHSPAPSSRAASVIPPRSPPINISSRLSHSVTPTLPRSTPPASSSRRLSSPQPGTSPTPTDRRSPSPRSPSPAPRPRGRNKKRIPTPDPNAPVHEYDICPTSYDKREGARGGRRAKMQGGKKVIDRTEVEKLGNREAKAEYFTQNAHLFGEKHDCWFNPYSTEKAAIEYYKRIEQPPRIQVGRGDSLLRELMGLRPNYEYFTDIRGDVRKAITTFQPKHIQLEENEPWRWSHYGANARMKIYKHIYKKYPFLQHFRDQSNEDCWVIRLMAQQYLMKSGTYQNKKNKGGRFIRRHPSMKAAEEEIELDVNEEEEEDKDEEPGSDGPDNQANDYSLNAPAYASTTRAGRSQTPASGRSQPKTTARTAASSRAPQTTSRAPPPPPPQPRAEQELEEFNSLKGLGLSKAASKVAATSKGKGKQRERQPTPPPKRPTDNESSEEEEIRPATKKIKVAARPQARLVDSPESSPVLQKVTQKSKSMATKKRKAAEGISEPEELIEEIQEPPAKKRIIKPKIRPIPPAEPMSPEPESPPAGSSGTINITSSDVPDASVADSTVLNNSGSRIVSATKAMVPVPAKKAAAAPAKPTVQRPRRAAGNYQSTE
ncbi:hypothetical protein FRC07_002589 [Ceratobasidium sp. 392]|nr:hypothetical protein FRC07_002589 [Ceratobasidium sp. 392]